MIGAITSGLFSRAGTPAPSSPVAGYNVWLDAADTATITTSLFAVTQWTDKSANAYAFTQGTATARPTSGVSTKNGKNVITFDGGDFLTSASASSTWSFLHSSQYTIFYVVKGNTSSYYGLMGTMGGTYSTRGFQLSQAFNVAGDVSHDASNGTGTPIVVSNATAGSLYSSGAFYCASIVGDLANGTAANRSTIQVNAGTDQKNNPNTNSPSGAAPAYNLQISGTGNGVELLTGTICEILIYPSILSGANILLNNQYLAAKWAI